MTIHVDDLQTVTLRDEQQRRIDLQLTLTTTVRASIRLYDSRRNSDIMLRDQALQALEKRLYEDASLALINLAVWVTEHMTPKDPGFDSNQLHSRIMAVRDAMKIQSGRPNQPTEEPAP